MSTHPFMSLAFDELPEELQVKIGLEHKSLWSQEHNRRVLLRKFGYMEKLPQRQRPAACGFQSQEDYDSYDFSS